MSDEKGNRNLNPDQFGPYAGDLGLMAEARIKSRFGGGHRETYDYSDAFTEPASVEWAAKEAHRRGADSKN